MILRHPTFAVLAASLAVFVATATAGRAADDPSTLKKELLAVEGAIDADRDRIRRLGQEAAEQARQLGALRAEMQAAARAVQAHERAITRLERERSLLRAGILKKRDSLAKRRGQLGTTLAALQRIALRPSSALLVAPGDPNDIVRSGLLIRTAIPRIEARATALRDELRELAILDAQLAGNKHDLEAAGAAMKGERVRISALVGEKNVLLAQTRAEQDVAKARIEELTRTSRNLGELLEALMQRGGEMRGAAPVQRPDVRRSAVAVPTVPAPGPSGPPVSLARGQLTPPAQGEIVMDYGARNSFGATSRGVTWRTRPAATVVAPWDGRVVFAGPFRHFGRILIIDHGEGYHSLIAGLAHIEARAGQWVLAGEPVGATGDDQPASDPRSGNNGGGGPSRGPGDRAEGPTVYVEFRRNGQPINPLPWLAASIDRTNG